jgi:hypothetical protein
VVVDNDYDHTDDKNRMKIHIIEWFLPSRLIESIAPGPGRPGRRALCGPRSNSDGSQEPFEEDVTHDRAPKDEEVIVVTAPIKIHIIPQYDAYLDGELEGTAKLLVTNAFTCPSIIKAS